MNQVLQLKDKDSKTSFILTDIMQSCSSMCIYVRTSLIRGEKFSFPSFSYFFSLVMYSPFIGFLKR
jgi:hypothetical protein